jgi:hypothetical protein
MTCAITFCRAIKPVVTLAKTIVIEDGIIVGQRPAPNAFVFAFTEVPVRDIASLTETIEAAAERGEIAVRAKPKGRQGRRAIYDDAEKGPAGLTVVPRCWVGFDWDGIEADGDPLTEPEIGARHALRRLPPAFRDASCAWQISASAGFKPGFRLRTWHWLNHPTTGSEMKVWCGPAIQRNLLDHVTLVECQPHYLAVHVEGGADPCLQRFGILRGDRSEVMVPDIAGMKRRQDQRDREMRRQADGNRPIWRDRAQAETYAQRRIEECLATICSATARHPTYTREAARARAICEHYGLAWEPVRQALISAYESTLTTAEVNARWRSSTEGVLRWIERRTAA